MSSSDGSGSSTSDPRYGSVERTPVDELPGFTDTDEIRNALDDAATRVELDLNGGQPIENPDDTVDLAARTFATYKLARTLVGPNSQRGGDLGDDGSRRETFAQQYLDEYENMVESIIDSDTDADGDPDEKGKGGRPNRKAYFTHRGGDGKSSRQAHDSDNDRQLG